MSDATKRDKELRAALRLARDVVAFDDAGFDTVHTRLANSLLAEHERAEAMKYELHRQHAEFVETLRAMRGVVEEPWPADREPITWHDNGRGPRIVVPFGNESLVINEQKARVWCAALFRVVQEIAATDAHRAEVPQ